MAHEAHELSRRLGPTPGRTVVRGMRLRRLQNDPSTATDGPIHVVHLDKRTGDDGKLGLRFAGGCETEMGGLFVTGVAKGGAVAREGSIQEGARLLECDDHTLLMRTQSEGADELRASGAQLRLVFQQLDAAQWANVRESSEQLSTSPQKRSLDLTSASHGRGTGVADAAGSGSEDDLPTSGEIATVTLVKPAAGNDLGFTMVGSCEDSFGGVFVEASRVPALMVGDRLLAVNNRSLLTSTAAQARQLLADIAPGTRYQLSVMHLGSDQWDTLHRMVLAHYQRHQTPDEVRHVRSLSLARNAARRPSQVNLVTLDNSTGNHGLVLFGSSDNPQLRGVVVRSIVPASAAASAGRISVGDRILEVDGATAFGATAEDLRGLLDQAKGSTITLAVQRPPREELTDILGILETQSHDLRTATVRRVDGSLGFSIMGPSASASRNQYQNYEVVVHALAANIQCTPPQGLQVGDQVIKIDDTEVQYWPYDRVLATLQDAGDTVQLTVRSNVPALRRHERELRSSFSDRSRLPSISRSETLRRPGQQASTRGRVITITRPAGSAESFGFRLRGPNTYDDKQRAFIVQTVKPKSPAALQGVTEGQQILAIDGQRTDGMLLDQIYEHIKQAGDTLRLTVQDHTIRNIDLPRDSSGSLNFAVIGAAADNDMVGVYVSRVTPNSPAATAGLSAGDRILAVNGQACEQLSSNSVVDLLQGGSSVRLVVQSQPSGFEMLKSLQQRQAGKPKIQATSTIRRPGRPPQAAEGAGAAAAAAAAGQTRMVKLNRDNGPLGFSFIGPNNADLPAGVFVSNLKADSEGEKQGLRVGDRIVAINGQAVADYPQCTALLAKLRHEIALEVQYDPVAFEKQVSSNVPVVRLGEVYVNSKNIYRVLVDEIDWAVASPNYNPPQYTAPSVMHRGADPLTPEPSIQYNQRDAQGIDRRSHTGEYTVQDGVPLNPSGRTGLAGRGALLRWGPNHSVASVVTRWSRGSAPSGSQRMLEFVAVKPPNSGTWHLPGGLVEETNAEPAEAFRHTFGEQALGLKPTTPAEQRQAAEQALQAVFDSAAHRVELYRGMVQDPRNTDNAWVEVIARHFHGNDAAFHSLPLCGDSPETQVAWLAMSDDMPPLSRAALSTVTRAATSLQAYVPKARQPAAERDTLTLLLRRTSATEPFGFNLIDSPDGAHMVTVVKPNSPAANLLQFEDELVSVGDRPVAGLNHEQVVAMIQTHTLALPLTVMRAQAKVTGKSRLTRLPTLTRTAVQGFKILRQGYGQSFGFSLGSMADGRHFVSKVSSGGLSEGLLLVGDELLLVNGHAVAGLSHPEVLDLCCREERLLSILVRRPTDAQPQLSRTTSGKMLLQMQVPGEEQARTKRPFLKHQVSVGREVQKAEGEEFTVELTRKSTKDAFGFSLGHLDSGEHTGWFVSDGLGKRV